MRRRSNERRQVFSIHTPSLPAPAHACDHRFVHAARARHAGLYSLHATAGMRAVLRAAPASALDRPSSDTSHVQAGHRNIDSQTSISHRRGEWIASRALVCSNLHHELKICLKSQPPIVSPFKSPALSRWRKIRLAGAGEDDVAPCSNLLPYFCQIWVLSTSMVSSRDITRSPTIT